MDEETFEPCPQCGSGYVELTGNPIAGKRWVACGMCKHTGPLADTEWEAIERWNAPSRVKRMPVALEELGQTSGPGGRVVTWEVTEVSDENQYMNLPKNTA